MTLFGTDGIRGRYGEYPLDDSTISNIGYAISRSFNDKTIKKIFIAHDGRESSNILCQKIIEGIFYDREYQIIFLGLFPTPALTFILSQNSNLDAIGIEITASHNPYSDNGIKVFDKLGFKITFEQEAMIEKILGEQLHDVNKTCFDLLINNSARELYIKFISKLIHSKTMLSHKLRIAVDCANGAMSNIISEIKWPENISLTLFNHSPDGKNINHQCGAVHPEYLLNIILDSRDSKKSDNFDFGVCFDGDGDRAIIVSNSGNILDGDDLLYLFSFHSKENKKVVGTVMTNYGIRKNLEKNGIDFLETDVGDKNVLQSIINNHAFIGAESSGHIIHTNVAGIPIGDGLVTMIKFIHLLYGLDNNINAIYPTSLKIPSKLINIESMSPDDFLKKNQLIFSKVEKILENNGRILVRKSGTQSLIRVLIEHESAQILRDAEKIIKSIL